MSMYSENVSNSQRDARLQRVEVHALDHREVLITVSRTAAGQGAMPKPQLPITAVVTPSEGDGDIVGSHVTCAS